ncbi:glycosyltransferase family 1 protein [Candidatus Igneacidithiobacillus taiwanensis]|uniref:glycosyltransferase family 4 protein n=1 Tax=Candidatus Igneacidithiobacillus taiwanensis TaxID=1945924 RepID=UPI0028A15879|nr:glycosyltransferase family 1 protein [Candidatus Igneacidithiobacillus taiwanensis]
MAEQASSKLRVLMEMRPALDGFYGIPQETRLLYGVLSRLPDLELSGLLQMSKRSVRGGIYGNRRYSEAEKVHRFSRVVVSLKGNTAIDWKDSVGEWLDSWWQGWRLRLGAWLGLGSIPLGHFETRYFRDFIWQELYGRSLPAVDRESVLQGDYRVCAYPWRRMHLSGIERSQFAFSSRYPKLDTRGIDVLIAQTPFPARVQRGTQLVVHYHDAIPVLMPHTISDRAFHQASHFQAMAANVRDGAQFVCVSETTRQDLLNLFPEAEPRAHTIHNMLPSHYFPAEPEPERIPGIVRRYLHGEFEGRVKGAGKSSEGEGNGIGRRFKTYKLARSFRSEEEKTRFYQEALHPESRFLLMVSTIEPRKNHSRLLEAWEALRSLQDPDLKLILVGHIGWDYQSALEGFLPWIEQGSLFLLHSVPADALRLLFRQAVVTVCPSVGEGFDFSGVEAMRCGGIVAASDIPVHREVYGAAAHYFDPYDTQSLVEVLRQMIYHPDAKEIQQGLRETGIQHSAQYLPEKILPQWQQFLHRLSAK